MEAQTLPDGCVRLVLPHSTKPSITSGFSHLRGCLGQALYALRHERDEYPGHNRAAFEERVGIPYEQARAIIAELMIIEHDLLGVPRGALNPHTGRREGRPPEPKRAGTEWDRLPRIEAEMLPEGGGMALTLGRGELTIFANSVDVALGLGDLTISGKRESRHRQLVGTVSAGHARARSRWRAVLIRERCVKAWGKLPRASPLGPISSA